MSNFELIEEIMQRNLDEKYELKTIHINFCSECRYCHKIWDDNLPTIHICAYDKENLNFNVNEYKLYEECPINHEITQETMCIKRYGIIHTKPNEDYYYRESRGSIKVVDFGDTTFEWDGYNPDVNWESIAVFFYENDDEKSVMSEMALELYNRLNMDSKYVVKKCYG